MYTTHPDVLHALTLAHHDDRGRDAETSGRAALARKLGRRQRRR